VAIDALMAKVRDLVSERIRQGLQARPNAPKAHSIKEIITYLDKLSDPDQVADLVSCALLPGPNERQTILETIEIEPRLKHLIHFLMAEISQHRKNKAT
jgi:ATP-dependent Lon protease